jgi:molybdopterin converting factor small subunit
VTCLFFAQCADWAGTRRLELEEAGPLRLSELPERFPALAFLKGRMDFTKVAVNRRLATWETEVRHGDDIAFMPPFSGG